MNQGVSESRSGHFTPTYVGWGTDTGGSTSVDDKHFETRTTDRIPCTRYVVVIPLLLPSTLLLEGFTGGQTPDTTPVTCPYPFLDQECYNSVLCIVPIIRGILTFWSPRGRRSGVWTLKDL